jgi:hypothetical protein
MLAWVDQASVDEHVAVGLGVDDGVKVGVTVAVGVMVGVLVGVLVDVFDGVSVGVSVDVLVGVSVGVLVAVSVGVLVGVSVGVLVGVTVGVFVGVSVGVVVGVFVLVGVGAATTNTSVVDERQLFVSLVSVLFCRSSAHATRKYDPSVVLVGTVTLADPVEEALGNKVGTVLLPVRRIAELSLAPSADR